MNYDVRLRFLSCALEQGRIIYLDDDIITDRGEDLVRMGLSNVNTEDIRNYLGEAWHCGWYNLALSYIEKD
jgi:hypothetical protein